MSNKNQTAVDFLIEQIKSKADKLPTNTKENRMAKGIYVDCLLMARQTKEMEKQQIEEAWDSAYGGDSSHDGEQYYKETYEQ
jgi:hypothetical protein